VVTETKQMRSKGMPTEIINIVFSKTGGWHKKVDGTSTDGTRKKTNFQ
jgi:hypothetical protein